MAKPEGKFHWEEPDLDRRKIRKIDLIEIG
jgi:hypothetical protein